MEPLFDGGVPLFQHHRALLIGVKDYKHDLINLRLGEIYRPDADVIALKETLISIGYSETNLECLCNEEATLTNIKGKLHALGKLEPQSELTLIFWAGHGYQFGGNNYLLPWEADLDALDKSALSIDEFSALIAILQAAHTAIFVDTCFSKGSARTRMKFPGPFNLPDRVLVFVGASSDEAIEDDRGGLLFTCLRDSLKGKYEYLTDEKGIIYLNSLPGHLQTIMPRKARVACERARRTSPAPQQNPFIFSGGNEPIAIGLDCRKYLGAFVTSSTLPDSVQNLATMAIDSYCRYWDKQDE